MVHLYGSSMVDSGILQWKLVSNPHVRRSAFARSFVALSSLKVHTQTRGAEIIMFQAATYTAETAHGEGVVGLQKNWPAEKISLASTNVVVGFRVSRGAAVVGLL